LSTRYSLIGATAILAELKALGIRPLPSPRTIERVLQRNGLKEKGVRNRKTAFLRQYVRNGFPTPYPPLTPYPPSVTSAR
jgi:hypothetical protein